MYLNINNNYLHYFCTFQNSEERTETFTLLQIKFSMVDLPYPHIINQDVLLHYLANRSLSLDIWSSSHLKKKTSMRWKFCTYYVYFMLKWKPEWKTKKLHRKKIIKPIEKNHKSIGRNSIPQNLKKLRGEGVVALLLSHHLGWTFKKSTTGFSAVV